MSTVISWCFGLGSISHPKRAKGAGAQGGVLSHLMAKATSREGLAGAQVQDALGSALTPRVEVVPRGRGLSVEGKPGRALSQGSEPPFKLGGDWILQGKEG